MITEVEEGVYEVDGAELILVEPAGLSGGMLFRLGPVECGHIKDGISVSLTDIKSMHFYPEGGTPGWVIDFKDLEKVYLRAKK